ncbi:methionyl-tRNA formyltransferase [Thioalkalivibrio sp. XN8]|uniref:methionyl-tRNA formyltransferase n=1 Tax=Thioalkalivibrio sp. XN8 TaxID=2712863 RepID=UPI0013EB89D8|nr:methionyl-tRNA formyltransferase [Thioalkalivibrio sp. XN8]NGP53787.1 methionyl-tRNA formyltransferase [Thioalkalivibrio sp. XN8]
MTKDRRRLRIGWLSHHVEGVKPLHDLITAGYPIECIITLDAERLAIRSGAANFAEIAVGYGLPCFRVRNINDEETLDLLTRLDLDVLLVIGWSQILGERVLRSTKIGCFGAHASLLPANRGSAPVNWALIRGERYTGNTLIRLAEDVDSGDIVAQRRIEISPFDNVATLYERVAMTNSEMLLELVDTLLSGRRPDYTPQVSDGAPLLPRRRPEDGLIKWEHSAGDVYNFIRALTNPYPGAFSFLEGRKYLVWRAALLPLQQQLGSPGTILGPVYSDLVDASGMLVACGVGGVVLLEIENHDGQRIQGASLAEGEFRGKWDTGGSGR